jgi:hypothetical protein
MIARACTPRSRDDGDNGGTTQGITQRHQNIEERRSASEPIEPARFA